MLQDHGPNTSDWKPLNERLAQETATRVARISSLSSTVDELFPGDSLAQLRADIKDSFNTPQLGKYHNEGVFMDTHLDLIVNTINDIRKGNFNASVPAEIKEILSAVSRAHHEDLLRYTLLHDLEKPSCLTVTFDDGTQRELQKQEALNLVPEDMRSNCTAAMNALKALSIAKISYFHPSEQKQHGEAAVNKLRPNMEKLGISETILKAIELHEVAYQFDSPKAANFRKHFAKLSADEQAWALTACYIDLQSSLTEDGKPDISPFLTLVKAMQSSQIVSFLESQRKDGGQLVDGIDPAKFDKFISKMLNDANPIELSAESALETCRNACRYPRYNGIQLRTGLDGLVQAGTINRETATLILSAASGDDLLIFDQNRLSEVRSKLGKSNAEVSRVLKGCEVT